MEEREVSLSGAETPSFNRIRNIEVVPLDYGFIVKVGCQSIAIENNEDVIKYLADYIRNPDQTESKYYKKELLKYQK